MPSPKSGISTRDTMTGLEICCWIGTSNHTRDRGTESRGSRRRDSGQRGPDRGGLHPPVLRTCGCVTGLAPRSRRMVPRVLPTKEPSQQARRSLAGSVRVTTREIGAQPADLVAVIGLRGPDCGGLRSRRRDVRTVLLGWHPGHAALSRVDLDKGCPRNRLGDPW